MLKSTIRINIVVNAILFLRFFSEYIDLILSSSFSNILGAGFIILFLTQIIKLKTINIQSFRYFTFWLIFCFSLVISSLISPLIEISSAITLKEFFKYLSVGIVFYLVYSNHKEPSAFYQLIKTLYIAVLISCIFSISQGILGLGKNVYADGIARTSGFMSDPVIFGVMLVMVYCIFDTFNENSNSKFNFHLRLILCLILIALFYTKARSAWIMFFIYFFLKFYSAKGNLKAKILFPLVIASGLPFLITRFEDLQGLAVFIEQLNYTTEVNYGKIESSFHWRIYQWIHLLSFWNERIIFGFGSTASTVLGLNNLSAHNSIVEVLVEQGIIGLLLVLYFVKFHLFGSFNEKSRLIKFLFFSLIPVAIFSLSFINQTFNLMIISILIAYKLRLNSNEK